MIALVLAGVLAVLVPVYILSSIRLRRRVDALADLAGVRRIPGESNRALIERAGRRFRVIDRGSRRG